MPGGLFNFRISFQLGGPDRRAGNDGGRFDLSRNQVDVLSDRLARSLRARRPRRRRRRTDAAATNCDMHARDPATGSKTRKRSRWTATPSSPASPMPSSRTWARAQRKARSPGGRGNPTCSRARCAGRAAARERGVARPRQGDGLLPHRRVNASGRKDDRGSPFTLAELPTNNHDAASTLPGSSKTLNGTVLDLKPLSDLAD